MIRSTEVPGLSTGLGIGTHGTGGRAHPSDGVRLPGPGDGILGITEDGTTTGIGTTGPGTDGTGIRLGTTGDILIMGITEVILIMAGTIHTGMAVIMTAHMIGGTTEASMGTVGKPHIGDHAIPLRGR